MCRDIIGMQLKMCTFTLADSDCVWTSPPACQGERIGFGLDLEFGLDLNPPNPGGWRKD